jgi:hypothetical protein
LLQDLKRVPEMGELCGVGTSYSGIESERGLYGRVSSGQLAVEAVRPVVGRDPPVSCTKYQFPRASAISTRIRFRMVSHVTSTGGIPKIGPIRTTAGRGVA